MVFGKRKIIKPAAPKRSTRPLAEGSRNKCEPAAKKLNGKTASRASTAGRPEA